MFAGNIHHGYGTKQHLLQMFTYMLKIDNEAIFSNLKNVKSRGQEAQPLQFLQVALKLQYSCRVATIEHRWLQSPGHSQHLSS
jgi:hypothetical protein